MNVTAATFDALRVTLQVAGVATLLSAPVGIAIGYLLARKSFAGKSIVETLVALPLVLPPTAIGYLLLRLFARQGWLGVETLGFDPDVLLTWRGAVLAAATMSLPLVARTSRVAFEGVPARLETMGESLGLSPVTVFARITLPLAKRGLIAALLRGFCRALGEFGATIVVAGNIAGRTQTLALAIFDDMQLGRDEHALQLIGISVVIAFACIFTVERLQRARGAA
jgi:molybdate transport system permease protein